VLLHSWGAERYGEWLLMFAIPGYLTLSDAGFGDASGSDMTARVAAGDRKGALETFQSSWAVLTVSSVALGLLALSTVWFVPWAHWLRLSTVSTNQAARVMLILGAYVLAGQQGSILESGFRCDGNYALGTFIGTIVRLIEAVIPTVVGVVTGRFAAMAFAHPARRAACLFGYAVLPRRVSPWLRFGFGYARRSVARSLIRPALGLIAFPAAQAISIQGFTILIGTLLGPVAVTAFTTLRTLSRLSYQATCTLARAVWPELSSAFGAGNILLARKLHRQAFKFGLLVSTLAAMTLWAIGPYVYLRWTRHAVPFDARCFHVLLIVSLVSSLWYISSVVPMSANLHFSIAVNVLAVTLVSLGLARILLPQFGLAGAAAALLLADLSMCRTVFRAALRQTRDTARDFLASALLAGRPERFEPRAVAAAAHD
jgi:O-antigen/teichoic acid export membrane protein